VDAFLARTVRDLKPGRALDVAIGQERNSVFLAKQGWDVAGYGLPDAGLAIARANAEQAGVRINAVQASHDDFEFGNSRWRLIVTTDAFTGMRDQKFIERVCDSLAPGRIALVEQINSGGMQPGPPNALFGAFQQLAILHDGDAADRADWSTKPARTGGIVAQKR
jgi:2-polyprenyl-3-methyl-5-hydroxy-6-metoxy-1,4-benzoquinol methylase